MNPSLLLSRHVRLFATAEAARDNEAIALQDGLWCTTFVALIRAFAGLQTGIDGAVYRSIDVASTRFLMREIKHPTIATQSDDGPNSARRFSELRALCRALMQLRAAGITAQHCGQFKAASPSVQALFSDLHAYEQKLATLHLSDTADVQRGALLRAATGVWPSALHRLETITVEPGVEVFDLRRDLLRVLAARGVAVTVELPYSAQNPSATPWAEAMLHGFEAQAHFAVQLDTKNVTRADGLEPLGQLLVQRLMAAQGDEALASVPPAAVQLTEVPPHDALITYVMRTVKSWLDAGIVPSQMAVVLPGSGTLGGSLRPDQLGPRLMRALAGMQVPSHVVRGPPLSELPHGRRLLGVVQLAQELDALPEAPPTHLFDEAGLNVALWASSLQWAGAAISQAGATIDPAAQAQLLRRCGHRRLGPRGLRRALGALRGINKELADAAATAAEAYLSQWVLPLTGGVLPLGDRVRHLQHLLAHVVAQERAQDATSHRHAAGEHADTQLADALVQVASTAQSFGTRTSLPEAYAWISGALGEVRGPRPVSGMQAPGVALLTREDIVGRRFSHVLALGLNNLPSGSTTGPLSEAIRREINQGLGYKLLQYGPVTGRAPLPLGAQQQFYFYELLRACTQHFCGVVLRLADEEQAAPSADLARLMAVCNVPLALAEPAPASDWHHEPSRALALRQLVAADGLPWALACAPHSAMLLQLARGAQRMGPTFWPNRAPLLQAHAALVEHHVLGHVVGVSSLDQLAMCRYRYFAASLLNLSHEPHPEHHIDRRRAGEAAHRALYHVYATLLQLNPWHHWRTHPAAALDAAATIFADKKDLILPPAWVHEDLREGAFAVVWHSVTAQLQRDLQRDDTAASALEYRFGDPVRTDRPPLQVPHPKGQQRPLQVRGTIDRVDVGEATLHVIDYKSTLPSRDAGRHFQLGLYQAVALRELAPLARTVEASWQLLGQPSQGPSMRRPEDLCGPAQDVVARTYEAVWARVDTLLRGQITPDPAPKGVCSHCDFIKLCRYHSDARDVSDVSDEAEA